MYWLPYNIVNVFRVSPLKFTFSKKATKIDKIFTVNLTICSNHQIDGEDFVNFCGLLRKTWILKRQRLSCLKLQILIFFSQELTKKTFTVLNIHLHLYRLSQHHVLLLPSNCFVLQIPKMMYFSVASVVEFCGLGSTATE